MDIEHVQRCNSTCAGLGYLEVSVDCSLNGWYVRIVYTDWGKWRNSTADCNHNHVNTALKQRSSKVTSGPHHHANHKQTYKKVHISIPVCVKQNKMQNNGIGHQLFYLWSSSKGQIGSQLILAMATIFKGFAECLGKNT